MGEEYQMELTTTHMFYCVMGIDLIPARRMVVAEKLTEDCVVDSEPERLHGVPDTGIRTRDRSRSMA